MTTKKILVVDDSAFMRAIISDLISRESTFEVVDTARDGEEAVRKVKELLPDAVTLDVEMPVQNGLQALQQIMAQSPTPVIMLSSSTEDGRSETLTALELGAIDFVCKPSPTGGAGTIEEVGQMLVDKLHAAIASAERRRQMERLKLLIGSGDESPDPRRTAKPAAAPPAQDQRSAEPARRGRTSGTPPAADGKQARRRGESPPPLPSAAPPAAARGSRPKPVLPAEEPGRAVGGPSVRGAGGGSAKAADPERAVRFRHIVAIGTSTGGPRALKTLLSALPHHLPAPVLIVQHMPPNFTRSLAERLDSYSELKVKEAEDGEVLMSGTAYIAPGGLHMTAVARPDGTYAIALNRTDPVSGHRPSVDRLFESLLPLRQLKRHAVLLTGMGSDGAKMMQRLAEDGATSTFAESEESCVVFGMPRAAIELGCVSQVIPLQDMAGAIVTATSG
ncbi:protein-glutamate methylesterase/protein-glutamine glutaminase [Paenibacillus thiaminolyticus]|uniref:Protein-glutamate methylesterase/protein-glutamine glutaminase n=17 Tax=Paenibacillus thiaminolyticus TaxID=49283 RepID=A0AAP9DZH4_PANTH|nr:chemotaxis response regulator protein-glutamate methylesterase [Paenibacillus thiaminolyticus]MCY9603248.1 chemotaxis response regulator protein-glutamate methylesterase [Paenibacillus thiaminolyticus]MCY9613695.1 chemotaxis response regulator protein-glutamate methylesterase [Paenibacillus thiaminolyticus]MCY9618857.1 chemotaxis response regulator protein-glutamate methylesterase [Paenibacillus thiaminolyticus]MCY9633415.1 chemotaxis response regulator protein-glutamate methylesterase [Paen